MKSFAITTVFAVSAAAAAVSNSTTIAVASGTAAAATSTLSVAQCGTQFYSCSTGPDANHAFCSSQYANCLGYNPFVNGTLVTPTANAAAAGVAYTTEVVTALTTYCPAATTLSIGGQVYTVSEATTLTITDCPCTLTMPVISSATAGATGGAVSAKGNATVTHTPVAYTGAAAAQLVAGSGFFAALAGAVVLL